jgi:5-methylcytosine-specific restriction endonuclease McrA
MPLDRVPASLRRAVADRADNHCEYCCCPADYCPDSFAVDHAYPRQLGGATILSNLVWACNGCNSFKQARIAAIDPETQQEVEFFNPRKQQWDNHFEWSSDFTQLIGLTPCGRATIKALKLNRTGVINLRGLLVSAQLHPPKSR